MNKRSSINSSYCKRQARIQIPQQHKPRLISVKSLQLIFAVILFGNVGVASQLNSLWSPLDSLLATKKATVGVSLVDLDNGESVAMRGHDHFPMQSVYKFHCALFVLHLVDSAKLRLDQMIRITRRDLKNDTWSPLQDSIKHLPCEISIANLLELMVSRSDNNACDILFRVVGGTRAVEQYIQACGIKSISIKATEDQMHHGWKPQFSNWTTPEAATQLLRLFYRRALLSEQQTLVLWNLMVHSQNPSNRIVAGVGVDAVVAHKTGTGGHNARGVLAAMNDIGIVSTPDGRHYALAVFVTMSRETDENTAKIIAQISSMVWECYRDSTSRSIH